MLSQLRILITALFFCACKTSAPVSSSNVASVDIPQTPVRDQYRSGMCWAYTSVAMVESIALKSGRKLTLSPEAIGFYRIAEELANVSKSKDLRNKVVNAPMVTDELIQTVFSEELRGGEVIFMDGQSCKAATLSGFDLLEKYGAWPEQAWSMKSSDGELLIYGIVNRFKDYLSKHPDTCCSIDEIAQNIMVSNIKGEFVSVPPQTFKLDGVQTTPKDFWKTLNFDVSEFVTVPISSDPVKFKQAIQWVKDSLALGIPVPIEFPVVNGHRADNQFKVRPDLAFEVASGRGHVVLITDWVNQGGVPGAVSPDQLVSALKADPIYLDYFVVKNSWGPSSIHQPGFATIPIGDYLIYRDYLEKAAAAPAVVNNPALLFVVLHKTIVN